MDDPSRPSSFADDAAVAHGDRKLLLQFLAGRDVECPQCRYNLRDLQSDLCPECGERIALRVQLVEPRQAAPIVGLIGLSAGVGFNALLILYAFLFRAFHPGLSIPTTMWLSLGGGLAVLTPLLL